MPKIKVKQNPRESKLKKAFEKLDFNEVKMTHVGLIAFVAFGLIFFTLLKGDFKLSPLISKAENENKALTYEDARNEVAKQLGEPHGSINEELSKQLASINPTEQNGKVLGESIGLTPVPAEKLFTKELLDQIDVATTQDNSLPALAKYNKDLSLVETLYDDLGIYSALNSSDVTEIKNAGLQSLTIVAQLKAMVVPSNVLEYHRYKILYYVTFSQLAETMAGSNTYDLESVINQVFSIQDKLSALRKQLLNLYNI